MGVVFQGAYQGIVDWRFEFTNSARWVPEAEEVRKKQRVYRLRKEPKMAYKKPQIVAKSASKQSFVAGCPTNTKYMCCNGAGSGTGSNCEIRRLK